MSLPAGVACDKSLPSSSTIRRRLLLMDCTAFSELLVVTVVDTAASFCVIEDSATSFFAFYAPEAPEVLVSMDDF